MTVISRGIGGSVNKSIEPEYEEGQSGVMRERDSIRRPIIHNGNLKMATVSHNLINLTNHITASRQCPISWDESENWDCHLIMSRLVKD